MLTLRASISPTGDMARELAAVGKPAPDYGDKYPVLVTLIRSDGPGQADVVGHVILLEAEAGNVKAAVDLWAQIPLLAEKYLLVWEGWQPPPTILPLGKIGKVLGMFGVRVNQVTAPPAALPQADGGGT